MTNQYSNPLVQALVDDLDENIVSIVANSGNMVIDLINPVTGTLDQVNLSMCDSHEFIFDISYTIDLEGRDRSNPEPFSVGVIDLEDLYDWILIEDVDTTAEVTDLWADTKGGSTMTI
jgi:hypothetical protein